MQMIKEVVRVRVAIMAICLGSYWHAWRAAHSWWLRARRCCGLAWSDVVVARPDVVLSGL